MALDKFRGPGPYREKPSKPISDMLDDPVR